MADYQRRYRELAVQLAEVGFIVTGTVVQRSTRPEMAGCLHHSVASYVAAREPGELTTPAGAQRSAMLIDPPSANT